MCVVGSCSSENLARTSSPRNTASARPCGAEHARTNIPWPRDACPMRAPTVRTIFQDQRVTLPTITAASLEPIRSVRFKRATVVKA